MNKNFQLFVLSAAGSFLGIEVLLRRRYLLLYHKFSPFFTCSPSRPDVPLSPFRCPGVPRCFRPPKMQLLNEFALSGTALSVLNTARCSIWLLFGDSVEFLCFSSHYVFVGSSPADGHPPCISCPQLVFTGIEVLGFILCFVSCFYFIL